MIKALISKLNRNQDGSILPIFGALVLMLVVIGGAAIDISRAVNAREKLAYAIDAAALSVAADLSTTVLTNSQITDKIENSFRANLVDAEFLDQAIENLNFVVDSDAGTVTVSSSAGLNNYFLNIPGFGKDGLGPEVFNFGTSAQVNYSRFDVELALVVDVTGSMSGDMATLRTASEGIVDILLPEDTPAEDTKVKISLVPYSAGVNLRDLADQVTTDANGVVGRSRLCHRAPGLR
jgi:Flp pilus assembly protein TadG